jgi:hypothetical protein
VVLVAAAVAASAAEAVALVVAGLPAVGKTGNRQILILASLFNIHPETPDGHKCSFRFENEQFFARSRKSGI